MEIDLFIFLPGISYKYKARMSLSLALFLPLFHIQIPLM